MTRKHEENTLLFRELEDARHVLNTLTHEEEKVLRSLLNYLNHWCEFPYALLGAKPMSIGAIVTDIDALPPLLAIEYGKKGPLIQGYQQGYTVLQKIVETHSKDYTLCLLPNTKCPGTSYITLIHKQKLRETWQAHEELFSHHFGSHYHVDHFLTDIVGDTQKTAHSITSKEALLGILLGFGKTNAELYSTGQNNRLSHFNTDAFLAFQVWRQPGFLCDPTLEETQSLRKQYRHMQSKIFWTFLGYDEMLVTISLLLQ